jgi:glycosyltransferase involved in cell wall biosynthesis
MTASRLSYVTYLLNGLKQGQLPTPLLARFSDGSETLTSQQMLDLISVTNSTPELASQSRLSDLGDLFAPEFYRAEAGISDETTDLQAFIHFLTVGLRLGVSPTPMFDAEFYWAAASEHGLPSTGTRNALLHWMEHGIPIQLVPTPHFDEMYYLSIYTDVAKAGLWGFRHFYMHGLYEGRRPSNMADVLWATSPSAVGARPKHAMMNLMTALVGQHRAGRLARMARQAIARATPADENGLNFAVAVQRQRDLLKSPVYKEIFERAQVFEPAVGEPASERRVAFPPYHNVLSILQRELIDRLPRKQYDTIVCVPFGKLGGADWVAGLLSKSLQRLRPGEKILILRTDQPWFERPDWYAAEADTVDFSDIPARIDRRNAEYLLYVTLAGLAPKRIFNVNSNLCWTTFTRFGKRLAADADLFAYLFCWDLTETGRRVGYPAEFFVPTIGSLRAVLTDTDYLRDELVKSYAVPPATADRIVRLWTPAALTPGLAPLVEAQIARCSANSNEVQSPPGNASLAGNGKRPVILWAGRFDRQKRFDLFVEIARRLPEFDFKCWGAAVLDAAPNLVALPANIEMHGPFRSLTDLPLEDADGWLYTSAWDGMPTILIEIATLGMPLVASAVGGVSELVRDDTAWPISEFADVDAYVAAVRDMVGRPDERRRRATALQRLAVSRYTAATYDKTMLRLLDGLLHKHGTLRLNS